MLLTCRPATSADFIAAYDSLVPWYGMPRGDLEKAFAGMLGMESVWSLVIEDADAGARPVSLSMTAFVSDRMADLIESAGCSPIGGAVATRFLQRGDEPLSLDRLRAAHHGEGLNLVTMHTVGLDVPLGDASTGLVGEFRAEQSVQAMRGFRLKRCFREVHGRQALASFSAGGWRLRNDYRAYFGQTKESPSLAHPFLMGLNREEALVNEAGGARMAAMFYEYPVRLGLRRIHRELLEAALEGLTDVELSERLSLSPSAIKKRWASIYELVDGLIPGLPSSVDRVDRTRGSERRRHVLNYLRDHPEEFRPLLD